VARRRTAARHPTAHPSERPSASTRPSALRRLRDAVDRPRYRNSRVYRNRGRGLVVLVVLIASVAIGLFVLGRMDTFARSATAAVNISRTDFFGGSGFDQSPAGNTIYYTYTVNGTTYSGVAFRRWINVNAHHPKVCFDPAQPSNHILIEGTFRCGIGP
jgi:hypothetical protein